MFIFIIHTRAIVEGFKSHPRCGICSCDGRNRIGAAEEAPRVEPPVPPKVERSVLPMTPDESAIPISVQGLPKRPARSEDQPKERAERPRTIRAAAAPTCRRFRCRARRRCRSSRPCPFRSRRRSTAWAAAPSIARTRFRSMRVSGTTPPIATSRCAPA
jgi:hypothetical protein